MFFKEVLLLLLLLLLVSHRLHRYNKRSLIFSLFLFDAVFSLVIRRFAWRCNGGSNSSSSSSSKWQCNFVQRKERRECTDSDFFEVDVWGWAWVWGWVGRTSEKVREEV